MAENNGAGQPAGGNAQGGAAGPTSSCSAAT
jgi:hypothetical protein